MHVIGLHLYVKKGLGPPLVLGLGLLLVGVPLMIYWRIRHPGFFWRDREAAESLDASAPPLTPGVAPVVDLMAGDVVLGYGGSTGSEAALAVAVRAARAFGVPLTALFGYGANPIGARPRTSSTG